MNSFWKGLLPARFQPDVVTIPVIRMSGIIAASTGMRQSLSLESQAPLLERAFKMKRAPGVAIIVNSPGGSPVQSRLIAKRIRDLAEEHDKFVHVFVEDVAASGGYMIAVAGDEIVIDPSSIVGSIGVIYAGFGFTQAIDKLGIERRVHTAGQNKMMLDPFQPEKPADLKRLKAMQQQIHDVFINQVKERRGAALKTDEKRLFTGDVWVGRDAVDLGLVDRIGDLRQILRERYGSKVRPIVLQQRGLGLFGLFRRVPRVGAAKLDLADLAKNGIGRADAYNLTHGTLDALDERGAWARFGL